MATAGVPERGPARAGRGWPWPELDLPNVLWFFGAVVAAGTSTVIVGKIPESSSDVWQFVAAAGFAAAYAFVALLLRRNGWRIPAGLAATVTAAMVPAGGYAFTRLVGAYPEDPFFEPFANYSSALLAVGCATVIAAALAYLATRVTFALLLAAAAAQASAQLLVPTWHATGDGRAITAIVVGAILVVVGLLVDGRGLRREGFWLHVAGLGGIAAALVYFAVASENTENQAWLPMLFAGAFVLLAGALLRRRVFAAFGAAGLGAALVHEVATRGDWFTYLLLGVSLVAFACGLLVYAAARRPVDVRSEPA